jgi:hypothetical protein
VSEREGRVASIASISQPRVVVSRLESVFLFVPVLTAVCLWRQMLSCSLTLRDVSKETRPLTYSGEHRPLRELAYSYEMSVRRTGH